MSNAQLYVSTQTCVPHIVVHWTPNYICKLQSFSNEKEYYFMERIIHFLLIKENRNTNKQKTTLGILKDVVIRMRPEYSFFLSGLKRFLGCGHSELWENPSVLLYIGNDWEITDLAPLQSVRKTWTEVQLEEPIIGLQGKGFRSVCFLPGRVCEPEI